MKTDEAAADDAAEMLSALKENISDVLRETCDPQAVHRHFDGEEALGDRLERQAGELGWLGLAIGDAHGGLALGSHGTSLLHRELGRHMAPGAFISSLAAATWVEELMDSDLRPELLARIMAGAAHCAIPATFDDQDGLTIDDSGVSGRLLMLGRPDSSFLIVPATTGDSRSDWALLASDGCIASRVEMWDRTRDLFHVTVDCAQPLFRFGGDAAMACALLSRQVYLALASDSIGLAAGVLSRTVEYLNTRIQFGKPLGTLQALKHRVAQHAANLSVYSALLEQALEAAPRDADLWATIAKADITAGCAAIAADCIQLHGGVGHTWEFDIHIFVKRAKLNEMLGGDNRRLRDQAANSFVKAARENRTTLEFQA